MALMYRPDIDRLRAIAVVLYHADPEFVVPGGTECADVVCAIADRSARGRNWASLKQGTMTVT
jgi:peptidoglycan/LPS O-acetylase OafA/YrhL